jgi:hypothetical protein
MSTINLDAHPDSAMEIVALQRNSLSLMCLATLKIWVRVYCLCPACVHIPCFSCNLYTWKSNRLRSHDCRGQFCRPPVEELVIQILHDVPSAVCGWPVMLVAHLIVFTEECSLRGLYFILQKLQCKCHLSCGKMYDPISWSPVIPHHTFTEKQCWKLLSTVMCGLS